jgi:hypothetical protein
MIKPLSSTTGALTVWVVSYLFFLLSLANNFSAAHDSISYLNDIVHGRNLFHQHHLLYHFFAHQWLVVLKPLFPSLADHYLIESFTAVWGSGTLAVCYLFFRNRFYLSGTLSAIGVTIIAFSYGMWFYSVNVEVYSPPLFFILSSLYIITKKEPAESDMWKIALLHSFAILFHQVNILFGFVIIYWIYVNRKKFNGYKLFLQYVLTGIVITGGLYIYIGWIAEGHNSVTAFAGWIMGYTVGHGYWEPLTAKTPFQVLTGFSRAFIGAHYIFQLPAVEKFLEESFRAHGLHDEIFLSENVSSALAWLLTILTAVFGVLFISLAVRFIMRFKNMKLHYQVLHPFLLCLLVYSLFFVFWMPEILEFWILQMVLIWILLIGMLPVIRFPFRLTATAGLVILSVSLFTINYFGSMRWLQNINDDWFFKEVQEIKTAGPSDLVIMEDQWILKDYVRYYTPAMVIADDEPGFSREMAREKVKQVIASHGRVYIYRPPTSINDGGRWELIQAY